MKILSMGDRIRPGAYAVKARFARSVLLLDAKDRALFVVDKSIGAGPLNVVVANPNAFASGETLAIALPRRGRRGLQKGSGWSRHDPVPVSLGPRFDSALPRTDRAKLARILASALPRHAPPESRLAHGEIESRTAHAHQRQPVVSVRGAVDIVGIAGQIEADADQVVDLRDGSRERLLL